MKLVLVALVASCGGPQSSTSNGTTTTSSNGTSSSTTAMQASATTTTSPGSTGGAVNRRPDYSCFSYTSRNSTEKRTACMRTADCGPYLDQAKQVGGIIEVSGCANAATVFCFASGDDEVCQPTLESCTSERTTLLKKGTSVQSDCAKI